MAETCRITERAAGAVVTGLESAGYLTRVRNGRPNHYEVTPGTLFRHPAEGLHEVVDLLRPLAGPESRAAAAGLPSADGGHSARGSHG